MKKSKITAYRLFMAVKLHLSIVWRCFGEFEYEEGKKGKVYIDWPTAWQVSSGIWLGGYDN
jgi:hypothetical protein